jgi:lysophospholipase L1-like esterase
MIPSMFTKTIRPLALAVLVMALHSCTMQPELTGLKNLPSVKYFAPEIKAFDSLNNAEDYPHDAILFTGSSSIRLWSTIGKDMSPYHPINRGFGGAKVEDLAYYLKRIVYPHDFRAIVLFAGTNNITGAPSEMPVDSILYWTRDINSMIRKKYPKVPIFWIAVTPTPSREKVLGRVQDYNRRMAELCAKGKNLHFIDTEKSYLDEQGRPIPRYFIGDMLHMNHEGYLLWSSFIKKELDRVLAN